jgi:hypothetical protein
LPALPRWFRPWPRNGEPGRLTASRGSASLALSVIFCIFMQYAISWRSARAGLLRRP